MQPRRLVNLRTLLFHNEIFVQCFQKLLGCQAVEIFHHAVIINDGQLVGREADGHEVIVLLVAPMMGILLGLLGTHQGGSRTAMVPVGNVKGRHLGKLARDGSDVFRLVDNPEGMAETVVGSHKVIHRFLCCIAGNEGIKCLVVGIGKEYRLDVGIVHADMLHAVFLLVATSQLVLLDDSVHIIRHVGTYHQAELGLAVHGLGVDIIIFLFVLHQPTLVLKLLEILRGLLIDTRIAFIGTYRKINLGLDDMIERHLITFGLSTGFVRVQHVVRA